MDDAGFAVVAGQRLLTTRAAAVNGRPVRVGGGLASQGFREDLFRQDFAEFEQEVFDLGELGSPRGPVRAVELLHKVFGDALDIGPHFFHQRGALLRVGHPCVLSELASTRDTTFSQ
jgi:hypothetical protein